MKRGVVVTEGAGAPSSGLLDRSVLETSVRRFGLLCGVIAGTTVVGLLVGALNASRTGAPLRLDAARLSQLALLVFSGGMLLLTRLNLHPKTVVRAGFVYQVLGALCYCVPTFYAAGAVVDGNGKWLSWVGPWILLFPLLIPARPLHHALSGIACASLPPAVSMVWLTVHGGPSPSVNAALSTFLPHYFCVALGVIPALLVYRYGVDLKRAKTEAREFGSYRLVAKLGAGGMGEVWRAQHRTLARPAALKLILPQDLAKGSEEVRQVTLQRFEQEAQMIAHLRSPHTVAIYDYGLSSDGSLYYVMELLEGLDLETCVERFGPLPPARVVHLLLQACESLGEAHDAQLVHRDIKPANLFLCRLGLRTDYLKVLDFGLAKAEQKREDVNMTGEGFIVGTPAYMAPEQGRGGSVDGRSDLYALGCVGFYLLTGRLVFEAKSAMAILIAHATTPPPQLSALVEGVPADLEELLQSCLAKEPSERPPTTTELAQRLAACKLPPWTAEDANAWWAAHAAEIPAIDTTTTGSSATVTSQPKVKGN